MTDPGILEKSLIDRFNRRIREIILYHNRFKDFRSGDDLSAVTYGMIMRSQIQDLLNILEESINRKED